MDVGTKLKGLRKDAGFTQKVIADYLGIKVNSYSQYENNVRKPNIDTLKKIADFYDISGISFFLDSDNDAQLHNLRVFINHYFDLLRDIRGTYLELKSIDRNDYEEHNCLMSKLLNTYIDIEEIQKKIDVESDMDEISEMITEYLKEFWFFVNNNGRVIDVK